MDGYSELWQKISQEPGLHGTADLSAKFNDLLNAIFLRFFVFITRLYMVILELHGCTKKTKLFRRTKQRK